ncbi:unnamed protein product [Amoebophrya sp. A120]|nr:unnamed protein product [Amoebophrya sp. A120]|eukprot:GSA120T00016066001.1
MMGCPGSKKIKMRTPLVKIVAAVAVVVVKNFFPFELKVEARLPPPDSAAPFHRTPPIAERSTRRPPSEAEQTSTRQKGLATRFELWSAIAKRKSITTRSSKKQVNACDLEEFRLLAKIPAIVDSVKSVFGVDSPLVKEIETARKDLTEAIKQKRTELVSAGVAVNPEKYDEHRTKLAEKDIPGAFRNFLNGKPASTRQVKGVAADQPPAAIAISSSGDDPQPQEKKTHDWSENELHLLRAMKSHLDPKKTRIDPSLLPPFAPDGCTPDQDSAPLLKLPTVSEAEKTRRFARMQLEWGLRQLRSAIEKRYSITTGSSKEQVLACDREELDLLPKIPALVRTAESVGVDASLVDTIKITRDHLVEARVQSESQLVEAARVRFHRSVVEADVAVEPSGYFRRRKKELAEMEEARRRRENLIQAPENRPRRREEQDVAAAGTAGRGRRQAGAFGSVVAGVQRAAALAFGGNRFLLDM